MSLISTFLALLSDMSPTVHSKNKKDMNLVLLHPACAVGSDGRDSGTEGEEPVDAEVTLILGL
jgi:hypothetical protein